MQRQRYMGRLRAMLIAAAALCLALPAGAQEAPRVRVIVNPANSVQALSRHQLEQIFLRKNVRWPGGERINPVDLPPESPVREWFSENVLRRSVRSVLIYWRQEIFSGRMLPPTLKPDAAAVVATVRGDPHAIGYVGADADLEGVKAIPISDLPTSSESGRRPDKNLGEFVWLDPAASSALLAVLENPHFERP